MIDFYTEFEKAKEQKVFKIKDLADLLHKEYDAVRMAAKRKSFSELEKQIISEHYFGSEDVSHKQPDIHSIEYKDTVILMDPTVMKVPLVSVFAYGSYLSSYGDQEYIDKLPEIPFESDREHRGEYLCFQVKGDSMDDGSSEAYLEGDILLCRNVKMEYWKSKLHINKWDFVIVHREKGIVVKRIIKHDVEKGIITLHSLNDYYQDYDVDLRDVAQIFNVVDFKRKPRRR